MFALFVFIIAFALLTAWIMTLIEIVNHEYGRHNKIIWMGFVFFMPFLGMAFYYLLGRKQILGRSSSSSSEFV